MLTAFEERVNLRHFNNYSRKQNHVFAIAHPCLQIPLLLGRGWILIIIRKRQNHAFAFFPRFAARLMRKECICGKLIITRASKTTLLRSATQFANTFAFGKRVNFNNHSKKAKPRFCLFPPICRMAYAGKVKPRDFVICVRLKHRAARKTPNAKRRTDLVRLLCWGFPQNHEIFFCQLKRKFVSLYTLNLNSTTSPSWMT